MTSRGSVTAPPELERGEMVERMAQATGGKTADARLSELGRLTDAGTTALFALAPPDREAAVLAAWRAAGVTGFVATVGRTAAGGSA